MPRPTRQNLVLVALLAPCLAAAISAAMANWRVFGVAVAISLAIGITLADLALRRGTMAQAGVTSLRARSKRESQRRHTGFSRLERHLASVESTARHTASRMDESCNRIEVVRQTVLDRFDHADTQLADVGRALGAEPLGAPHDRSRQDSISGRLQRLADDARLGRQYIVSEIDALGLVNAQFPLGPGRPVLSSWAMTPRGILQVTGLIESRRPELIVECGSGASTIYAALALRELGNGRLLALEHLADVAEAVNEQLSTLGLSRCAEVCHAPLVTPDERVGSLPWYSLDALGDVSSIDMLIVDGPPGTTGPLARLPAVPLLRARLSAHAVIVLDDADRDDERAVIRQWLTEAALERSRSATRDQAVFIWNDVLHDQDGPTAAASGGADSAP